MGKHTQQNEIYIGEGVDMGLRPFTKHRLGLKISKPNEHFMVFGTTRFGKTSFLFNLLQQYIANGQNVIVFDRHWSGADTYLLEAVQEVAHEHNRGADIAFAPSQAIERLLCGNGVIAAFNGSQLSNMLSALKDNGDKQRSPVVILMDNISSRYLSPGLEDFFTYGDDFGITFGLFSTAFSNVEQAIGSIAADQIFSAIKTKMSFKSNDFSSREKLLSLFKGNSVESLGVGEILIATEEKCYFCRTAPSEWDKYEAQIRERHDL